MFTLKDDELQKLADFLHKHSGILLSFQKLQRFKRKIVDVFIEHKIENFSNFYHRVKHLREKVLIQDLINAVTINETYFWREHEQFELLVGEVLPKYIEANRLNSVRILVSPCSSGEELYSIMLAILSKPFLLERLNIELVGIDIDSKMIEKAKRGLYSKRSVIKIPKNLLETYFSKVGELYKIDENLRKNAHFRQVNIFDTKSVLAIGKFDIVFSRNMLIYFNEQDQQKSFQVFHNLLHQKGYLFLGHADANSLTKELFSPLIKGKHLYKKV